MSDAKKPFPDPLIRHRLFPDPAQIFSFVPVDLKAALADGIVVVDTNVLLVPYMTGRASLEQIRITYERLTTAAQLRIPAQVAREFADNRAEKLKTVFQQLSRKREVNLVRSEYPLLENLPAYADVLRREAELIKLLGEYRKCVALLLDTIAAWHWDDPVSRIYQQHFHPSIVVDPDINREELLKELKYRQEHRIPPGYKDASNEYSGVGDLLIWKTLLQIGQRECKHLIFVSGDEKTDWRYQSENTALYPRFELLDEYRTASAGKSLLIISFAELLREFGAPDPIVAEVRQEESAASMRSRLTETGSATTRRRLEAETAVFRWLSKQYSPEAIHGEAAGGPDFAVVSSDGVEGYEVQYVRADSPEFPRRLREGMRRARSLETRSRMPVTLVVVADATAKQLDRVFRVLANSPDQTRASTVVIGTLNDAGGFQEMGRIGKARFAGEERASQPLNALRSELEELLQELAMASDVNHPGEMSELREKIAHLRKLIDVHPRAGSN